MSGPNSVDVALKSIETIQEKEASGKMQARIAESVKDAGPLESLRHTILSHVGGEKYDRAARELDAYAERNSDYPAFGERAGPLIKYCKDLIGAIRQRRNVPGFNQLAMAKQQEIFDKAMKLFDELKGTLKKIEAVERDVKLEDVRSTVLVMKAVVYSIFGLLVLGFSLELSRGILPAVAVILDSSFGELTNWLFDKVGL